LVDDAYFNPDNKFELSKTGLLAYSHGEYFTLGEKIGTFGYSVRKKQKPVKKEKPVKKQKKSQNTSKPTPKATPKSARNRIKSKKKESSKIKEKS
jgi:hypothetical protein